MTELEIRQPAAPAIPAAGSSGANLIREAAAVMADAHALATAVAGTQMIPKHFQGRPDECAAAMLYGASLGLDPMQSVRQIYVVHGQAALYARAMVALVLGAGHEVWTVESTDQSVTVAARRRGSGHVEQSTWTYDRANRAGYTNNAKYKTDPQAMLYSKAASEVCRKIAPDVLSGVYAVEELQMEQPWGGTTQPPRVTVQQQSGADRMAAILKPSGAEATETPTVSVGSSDSSGTDSSAPESPMLNTSSALAKRMFATMNDAGVTDSREARLEYVSKVLGREVGSSKELTDADAELVIDATRAALAEPFDVTDAEIVE